MQQYLIAYGADNEFWLCEADDADHAKEQFENADMGGEINEVMVVGAELGILQAKLDLIERINDDADVSDCSHLTSMIRKAIACQNTDELAALEADVFEDDDAVICATHLSHEALVLAAHEAQALNEPNDFDHDRAMDGLPQRDTWPDARAATRIKLAERLKTPIA